MRARERLEQIQDEIYEVLAVVREKRGQSYHGEPAPPEWYVWDALAERLVEAEGAVEGAAWYLGNRPDLDFEVGDE